MQTPTCRLGTLPLGIRLVLSLQSARFHTPLLLVGLPQHLRRPCYDHYNIRRARNHSPCKITVIATAILVGASVCWGRQRDETIHLCATRFINGSAENATHRETVWRLAHAKWTRAA
jgi:hypothetical protein